jgi:hypothetical protein
MLIDFTTELIQFAPELYPNGCVVRVLDAPWGRAEVGLNDTSLTPRIRDGWTTAEGTFEMREYSLTEHEDTTALEENGYADFTVQSSCVGLRPREELEGREFSVNLIQLVDGWAVELGEPASSSRTIRFPLPQFQPLWVFRNPELIPDQKPEEKPEGRPIWDRLDEES